MIVTLTVNPTIDVSSATSQVIAEKKLRCSLPQYEPGGGGINVSKALCRLGKISTAVFTSGDVFGEHLENLLKKYSFQSIAVPIEGMTRENLIILEEKTNAQFRFNMPGPSLKHKECQAILDVLAKESLPMKFLVASGTLPEGAPATFYKQVAQIAHRKNAKFILDTSGEELKEAIGKDIFLLKVSLGEFQELINRDLDNESLIEQHAKQFIKKGGCEILVVSLAASGAVVISKDQYKRVFAPKVKEESRIGAGDSMVAGMVYALDENKSFDEMALLGIAAGTAAVMSQGTELCSKDHTFELLDRLSQTSSPSSSSY